MRESKQQLLHPVLYCYGCCSVRIRYQEGEWHSNGGKIWLACPEYRQSGILSVENVKVITKQMVKILSVVKLPLFHCQFLLPSINWRSHTTLSASFSLLSLRLFGKGFNQRYITWVHLLYFYSFCSQLPNFTEIKYGRGDSSINVALKRESLEVSSLSICKMSSSSSQSGGLTSSQLLRLNLARRHP